MKNTRDHSKLQSRNLTRVVNLLRRYDPKRHKLIESFTNKLGRNQSCETIYSIRGGKKVNLGMINIYSDPEFLKSCPTIWTDWEPRVDSKVAIIGQDWGPAKELQKLRNKFMNDLSTQPDKREKLWNHYINNPPCPTTNNLFNFLEKSAALENVKLSEYYRKQIFVTMAIFFARRGEHFRGNSNFAGKKALKKNIPLLEEQLDIIKPEIILGLGEYALTSLSKIYDFKFNSTTTQFIKKVQQKREGVVRINRDGKIIKIIPAFHPVAYRSKNEQINDYRYLWKNLKS